MNYLKSTMTFGQKNKNSFKKELDNEPVYNEEYLKANIKSYNGKINKISKSEKTKRKFSIYFFISNSDQFCFSNK